MSETLKPEPVQVVSLHFFSGGERRSNIAYYDVFPDSKSICEKSHCAKLIHKEANWKKLEWSVNAWSTGLDRESGVLYRH